MSLQADWSAEFVDHEAVDGDPANVDDVLDALADEERQRALSYLVDAGGAVSVERLVRAVGPAESDDGTTRAAIRFHHVHLPKLADVGLIEHDREEETVAVTDVGKAARAEFVR